MVWNCTKNNSGAVFGWDCEPSEEIVWAVEKIGAFPLVWPDRFTGPPTPQKWTPPNKFKKRGLGTQTASQAPPPSPIDFGHPIFLVFSTFQKMLSKKMFLGFLLNKNFWTQKFFYFIYFFRVRNVNKYLQPSFRPARLEHLKRFANLVPPRRVNV